MAVAQPYSGDGRTLITDLEVGSGLHPIRDRAKIKALVPFFTLAAKQLKAQNKKLKYRNMEVRGNCVSGTWQTAGPKM